MSPGFEKTNSKKGLPLAQPDASPIRPARHVGLAHFKVLRPDRVLDSNEEESLVKQPLKAKENPYIEKLAGTKKDECQDAQDNIGSSANPKEIIQVASIFGDLKVKPKYVSGHIAFMVTKDEKDFLSVLVPEIKLAVFKYLDLGAATCLGLTSKPFWKFYSDLHSSQLRNPLSIFEGTPPLHELLCRGGFFGGTTTGMVCSLETHKGVPGSANQDIILTGSVLVLDGVCIRYPEKCSICKGLNRIPGSYHHLAYDHAYFQQKAMEAKELAEMAERETACRLLNGLQTIVLSLDEEARRGPRTDAIRQAKKGWNNKVSTIYEARIYYELPENYHEITLDQYKVCYNTMRFEEKKRAKYELAANDN